MHTFEMMIDPAELEKKLLPILLRNGSEIPAPGCYIAAVEFDEAGEVVAYQMLQNAIFLEGLWARDTSTNMRRLHRVASGYAVNVLGVKTLMTMTRNDATGNRIGRIAEKLGFERMNWNIFRRKECR